MSIWQHWQVYLCKNVQRCREQQSCHAQPPHRFETSDMVGNDFPMIHSSWRSCSCLVLHVCPFSRPAGGQQSNCGREKKKKVGHLWPPNWLGARFYLPRISVLVRTGIRVSSTVTHHPSCKAPIRSCRRRAYRRVITERLVNRCSFLVVTSHCHVIMLSCVCTKNSFPFILDVVRCH